LSPTHERGLSPTHLRGLSPTHQRGLSPTHQRGLSPTHQRGLSPTHQRGLSPTHQRGLSPTHSTVLSPNNNVPKSGTAPKHRRGMSPGHHSLVLTKAHTHPRHAAQVSHQRTLSPKIGLKGKKNRTPVKAKRQIGGMGGMGRPKGLNTRQQFVPKRSLQNSGPRRIGPQQFRGGPSAFRR
jgi:hypothetical protein